MAPKKSYRLQDKDTKIIEVLKGNARLGVKQIARKTGIPITTVFNRIKNLEKNGVITGYSAAIDKKKLGKEIEAFIIINLAYASTVDQDEVCHELISLPEVDECYEISGATNILIKVSAEDIDTLNEFIIRNLKKSGVENISTYILIKKF
jgi:Lrp/AsnC family leucine-responsive transcriptional regulator